MSDGDFCLRVLKEEIIAEQVGDLEVLKTKEDEFRTRANFIGGAWLKARCETCGGGILACTGFDWNFASTSQVNLDPCINPEK